MEGESEKRKGKKGLQVVKSGKKWRKMAKSDIKR